MQLFNHFRGDPLWRAVLRPAVHYAMPHRRQRIAPDAFLDPVHQGPHRRRVVRCLHRPRKGVLGAYPFHPKSGLGQSNPLHPSLKNPLQRVAGLVEQRELDARRTAIDRQDAWGSGFHGELLRTSVIRTKLIHLLHHDRDSFGNGSELDMHASFLPVGSLLDDGAAQISDVPPQGHLRKIVLVVVDS